MPRRPRSKPQPDQSAVSSYLLDDQIGFRLRLAMQRHTAIFMARIPGRLTQTQFAALAKLLEVGACSQNHLGRLIYLDASTIKGVVDRLRARGLVAICDDPDDRRRRAVTLTDKGRLATEAAIEVAAEITARTVAPLSANELRQMIKLLRRLS